MYTPLRQFPTRSQRTVAFFPRTEAKMNSLPQSISRLTKRAQALDAARQPEVAVDYGEFADAYDRHRALVARFVAGAVAVSPRLGDLQRIRGDEADAVGPVLAVRHQRPPGSGMKREIISVIDGQRGALRHDLPAARLRVRRHALREGAVPHALIPRRKTGVLSLGAAAPERATVDLGRQVEGPISFRRAVRDGLGDVQRRARKVEASARSERAAPPPPRG